MKQLICLVAIVMLGTSCKKMFKAEPDGDPVGVFNELWRGFDESYAVFNERNMDWNAAYSMHAPSVSNGMSDEELFNVITTMLEPLDDGHVQLVIPGRSVWFGDQTHRDMVGNDLFRLDIARNYVQDVKTRGEDGSMATYGKIAGQPYGYLHFSDVSGTWDEFDEMLEDIGPISGLIIDLRHNRGGDFTWALPALEPLNHGAREIFRSRTRNGPAHTDFTPWTTWRLEAGDAQRNYRIVLLTDRFTISAGERAAMMLRSMDNTIHLGDTTNGALSTSIWRELPNGWYYRISAQQVEDPSGTRWEGIGLPPDQVVLNTYSSLSAGVDEQLEAAIDALQ